MNRVVQLLARLWKAGLGFLKRNPSYSIVVLGTTALTMLYFGLINSDRYVSTARIVVEREGSSSSLPQLAALGILGFGSSAGSMDAELVKRFIESPAMLDYLQEKMQLKEHYSARSIDYFSRLSPHASREDFLKYFLKRIDVDIDSNSLTMDLSVQAFGQEYAQALAEAMVSRAEEFVNDINSSLAREQIKFAQKELESSYDRLQRASASVINLQNKEGVFSPEIENESISQIIAGLQQDLATQRTELKALSAYLSETAPEVVAAKKKINALERQIQQERAKQVGGTRDDKLNEKLLKFQELKLNEQIATDIYQGGLRTLEAAKIDAARKVKYLVLVSPPTLPEESVEPRRLYIIVTVFLVLNILYVVGKLIVATIQDHRE